MNPFDLPGPEFLKLYACIAVAALGGAAFLRWYLRQPSEEVSAEELALDTYEIACLSGGPQRAIQAALSRLVRDGLLCVDARERTVLRAQSPPRDAPRLERTVYASTDGKKSSLAEIQRRAAAAAEPLAERLRETGLLLAPDATLLVRWLPSLLIGAAVLFGGIKILVGLSRHKPVGFLSVACLCLAAFAVVVLAKPPRRTRRGDRVLKQLREMNTALEFASARDRDGRIGGPDLSLAVALFGVSVLRDIAILDSLYHILKRRPGSSDGGCGGGGCGGGGCGGCS